MDLIVVSKWISATMVCCTFIVGLYKFVRRFEERFDNMDDHFKKLDNDLAENSIMTLKIIIMNDKLSLDERILAGEKYISLGGNGFVKKVYDELLEEKMKSINIR